MRSGRLLAEDSPQNLLSMHNLNSLEDVFLKLCIKERDLPAANNSVQSSSSDTDDHQQPQQQEIISPIIQSLAIVKLNSIRIINLNSKK